MTDTSKPRYCTRDEQCVLYDPTEGKPSRLSRYNPGDVCSACREKERNESVEEPRSRRPSARSAEKPELHAPAKGEGKVLPSAAEDEIRRLKYEMVISLFTRRGPFWELIRGARERWSIEPAVRVPPPMGPLDLEFLLRTPDPCFPGNGPDPYEQPDAHSEFLMRWNAELGAIYHGTVPEGSPARGTLRDWGRFLAACVLHDPPDDALLEFVAVEGPEPEEYLGNRIPEEFGPDELPRMLTPPIRTLQELRESPDRARDCLLYWLAEFLDKSGIDPAELLSVIERRDPEVRARYREKKERDSRRHFIEVTATTSWEDLRHAFSVYRASQEELPPAGSPSRDRLLAFQCAILHDRHRWTYRSLAERYGLGSVDTAKNYVKVGREILRQD